VHKSARQKWAIRYEKTGIKIWCTHWTFSTW